MSGRPRAGPTGIPLMSTIEAAEPFVRLNAIDDVVTAVRPLEVGTPIENVTTTALIPRGHKIATHDIPAGAPVRKYAQIIGYASEDIAAGAHVHDHNLSFRATDFEYKFATNLRPAPVPAVCSRACRAPRCAAACLRAWASGGRRHRRHRRHRREKFDGRPPHPVFPGGFSRPVVARSTRETPAWVDIWCLSCPDNQPRKVGYLRIFARLISTKSGNKSDT